MNTQSQLLKSFDNQSPFHNALCDSDEIGAFEALWLGEDVKSSKGIATKFKSFPEASHADLIDNETMIKEHAKRVYDIFDKERIKPSLILRSTYNYPKRLNDAQYPVSLMYARGNINFLEEKSAVAVIGTRTATDEGKARTKRLVKILVDEGFIIVSGLAEGIDTVAHQTAINNGGKTIAVMGVPISRYYPTKNRDLQDEIAKNHLLLSHVPVLRSYQQQDTRKLNFFFPERNSIMSALSQASIIVEASDTSGTLIQAKQALKQGRQLFILDSCFNNSDLKWPHQFLAKGAIRVKEPEDIIKNLG
ncbi:MAG: DNA-protecting protein DprA [Alphaproteobacteria bacterium]|nr:DNA-protecting protein DprA [Alphaproteobacteria bacterium]